MTQFTFDMKLTSVISIDAEDEESARKALDEAIKTMSLQFAGCYIEELSLDIDDENPPELSGIDDDNDED